jgi:hypothetical protein
MNLALLIGIPIVFVLLMVGTVGLALVMPTQTDLDEAAVKACINNGGVPLVKGNEMYNCIFKSN